MKIQSNRFLLLFSFFFFFFFLAPCIGIQSDELLQEEEEFVGGIEGRSTATIRRRGDSDSPSSSNPIEFFLEQSFGDSDFSRAGVFTARLKSWTHGGKTLTKLRFSRDAMTSTEKEAFERLLKEDDFYTIRVPSNVLNPPGKDFIVSSVRARCIPRDSLDEHFILHMDGVNILAVNYGSSGACQYPRSLKLPLKWSFNSKTVLKNSEQARRTPTFAEELLEADIGIVEGEGVKPPEKSLWAKYWMYLIPVGLIAVNAITQAMNMPEEQAGGQTQQAVVQRAQNAAATARRR